MIIGVKELQKVKGGDLKRKTGPLDVIISRTMLGVGQAGYSVPELISLPTQRSLSALTWRQSPFLCSIQSTCCPRNPLFVDKKHTRGGPERVNSLSLFPTFPDPTGSQGTGPRVRLDSRIPHSRC